MLRNSRIRLNDIRLNLAFFFRVLASNLGVLGLGAGLWPSTLIIILIQFFTSYIDKFYYFYSTIHYFENIKIE